MAAHAGLVGPNAVTQLARAMDDVGQGRQADAVFAAAGHRDWRDRAPNAMIPEAEVAAVHRALWALLSPDAAMWLAAEAGRRTADYVIANRIPAPARMLLMLLPPALAEPMLIRAIARHAWTFAGSGRFSVEGHELVIRSNPLALPVGCPWHEAVLSRMWQRLVHRRAIVREVACVAHGDDACRFGIGRLG